MPHCYEQVPAFLYHDDNSKAALWGGIICLLTLAAYCTYQVCFCMLKTRASLVRGEAHACNHAPVLLRIVVSAHIPANFYTCKPQMRNRLMSATAVICAGLTARLEHCWHMHPCRWCRPSCRRGRLKGPDWPGGGDRPSLQLKATLLLIIPLWARMVCLPVCVCRLMP